MAHQEVESSSLSGGDNIFFRIRDRPIAQAVGLIVRFLPLPTTYL